MNNFIAETLKYFFALCLIALTFSFAAHGQIATGGNYTLTQTAIANGGASGTGASGGGNYSLEGTAGQSAAGTKQQSGNYTFQPGFWTAQTYAPTAASVTIGGRVVTANGSGIRNVLLTLTRSNGEKRTVFTGSFGYFRFDDVTAGETCAISVSAKRYVFSQPSQVRSISENVDDLMFVADN